MCLFRFLGHIAALFDVSRHASIGVKTENGPGNECQEWPDAVVTVDLFFPVIFVHFPFFIYNNTTEDDNMSSTTTSMVSSVSSQGSVTTRH